MFLTDNNEYSTVYSIKRVINETILLPTGASWVTESYVELPSSIDIEKSIIIMPERKLSDGTSLIYWINFYFNESYDNRIYYDYYRSAGALTTYYVQIKEYF